MKKHKHLQRWASLESERSSWLAQWRELSQFFAPNLGRYDTSDRNRGNKRTSKIYDNTVLRAPKILAAGLMAGMTSPARPWFRLTTADPDLAEFHSVKTWLSDVQRIMLDVYARSNTYRTLQSVYTELGVFGTAVSLQLPDFDKVQHHYPVPNGRYALACDHRGRVNTMFREFDMTVAAMVGEFGYDRCSRTVKTAYDRTGQDKWVTVLHAIQPSDGGRYPFESCYFEKGASEGEYLREGGFKRFRALAPRWDATGNDIYGWSPGMESIGDGKQLQQEQMRKAQGIDFMTRPPLQAPTSLKGKQAQMVPGGITYVDAPDANSMVRPLFETRLDLNYLLNDIQDVRSRINSSFYTDLFLMLAQTDPGRMTATEVAERHEEKLLMLGPVLERLHDELLDPMIESTFSDLMEAQALPPPPQEMAAMPVRVEFVSMLAQAQRAIGTASVDRFIGNVGAMAQFRPEVVDKIDVDKWVDSYADMLGVDPGIIVPTEDANKTRQARAAAQEQAEQMAMADQAAGTAQKLGSVSTNGGESNAAQDILNLFSGYQSPSGVEAGL